MRALIHAGDVECGVLADAFAAGCSSKDRSPSASSAIEMLRSARRIYLINSVRKWMNADLSG